MAAPSAPNGNSHGYSFHPYPGDYRFSHHGFAPHPSHQIPPVDLPMMTQSPGGYHQPMGANSAMMQPGGASHTAGQLPPSPVMHNAMPRMETASPDTKMLRHVMTALGKMQNMLKDMAERQEQILDRMSVLEQRVGRMEGLNGRMDEQLVRVEDSVGRVEDQVGRLDEQCGDIQEQLGKTDDQVKGIDEQLTKTKGSVLKVLEQVELIAEDAKSIRVRVNDNESQDAFEKRLTAKMDGVVEKRVVSLDAEIKDIKKFVKDTEKQAKFDPLGWNGRNQYMGQRYRDALILSEEEQKEVRL